MLDLSSKIFNWIQIIFHQNQKTKMAIILNRLRKFLTGHYWLYSRLSLNAADKIARTVLAIARELKGKA